MQNLEIAVEQAEAIIHNIPDNTADRREALLQLVVDWNKRDASIVSELVKNINTLEF